MPQYCSQGHENPTGSRFCLQCGEKLETPVSQGIYPGQVLGGRYRIVRQLGHGGFGRTYLAEDINRFNEPCVLKEFAPQVQTTYVLQKAEELFEREAGVLYKLQHPQIPRFRELFRVNLDGKGYIFLVQDYVEGQTYRALVDARRQEGLRFNEAEVAQLLFQILPVLEYIHSLGVIHRDISPENLILRNSDWLPVLIDFGGVKQVAAAVASQYHSPGAVPPVSLTLLGKLGYAPEEQMRLGAVYPHSDLYALAATVLVLLTGKEPQELIDGNTLTWNWRQEVRLSPTLGAVLDKMLQPRLSDRYQSAHQVLQALTGNPTSYPPKPPTPHTEATLAVGGRAAASPPPPQPRVSTPIVSEPSRPSGTPGNIWLVVLPIAGALAMLLWAVNSWIQSHPPKEISSTPATQTPNSTPTETPKPKPTSPYSAQEEAQRQALFNRGKELGIDENFLFSGKGLVNQLFYEQNPRRLRPLTPGPEDADMRSQWYKIADGLLDTLEQQLSPEARRQLGSYDAQSRDRAKAAVNELHLSSRTLYDLADNTFFHLFPQQGQDFINQPIGQVWQGIVADKVKAVQAGTALERIGFDRGATSQSVSGTLKPGEGKAYLADLSKDQLIDVNLQADRKTLLSIYPPTSQLPALLKDSKEKTWSGKLERAGLYEFVITSTGEEGGNYQLDIKAENPTPTPSPQQTATPSATTTPSPDGVTTPSPKS